jgi:hypothetical protein
MFILSAGLNAQEVVKPRPLTMAEYEKAKTFVIKDLDNATYVKFENAYILDRYEVRKPYFITGDDGLKKRMDLYKLLAKEGMQELGLVIFYTNEKGTQYKACLPNFTADAKVWEKYFEDIHAIDKLEQNFVLKLSYVLSKEVGYQLYKAQNQGKDLSKESATYGNDICFPGDQQVTLANGTRKTLASLQRGDEVLTVNPVTKATAVIKVNTLVEHEAKNYAITKLVLQRADKRITPDGSEIMLSTRTLEATPNHPVQTQAGTTTMGDVKENETVLCLNKASGDYEPFTVIGKTEYAGGVQKVYNIVAGDGTPFLMNDVMVLQK